MNKLTESPTLMVPGNKSQLVQFLRDLANAIEKESLEYNGSQVSQTLERQLLPDGSYGEIESLGFELRVAVSQGRHYKLFREFAAA